MLDKIIIIHAVIKLMFHLTGDLFDIQGFHSVILENGAVPLNVLEELIVEWIHETHTGSIYTQLMANGN